MLIKDVARAAGVTPQVVRFYARSGLIAAAGRAENGYREFGYAEVKRIRFIRDAQSLGLTLAQIRELLATPAPGGSGCCAGLQAMLETRLRDIRHEFERLEALASAIEAALAGWRNRGCGVVHAVRCPVIIHSIGDACLGDEPVVSNVAAHAYR